MAMVIAIPKVLRERLSDEGADALVEIINKSGDSHKEDAITLAEQKFERRLAEEIGKLRADMIKWMFLFWVGQQAVLLGILFTFFK